MLPDAAHHGSALLRRVGRLPEAVITEVGGDYVGNGALLGLGYAKGNVVVTQAFVGLVGKPRWMAEFEGGVKAPRQSIQELLQQFPIRLQVRRKLEQDRAELLCVRQIFDCAEKAFYKFISLLETFYVSDHLVGFYTEAEMFGRFRDPFLDGGVFQQLAEAEV